LCAVQNYEILEYVLNVALLLDQKLWMALMVLDDVFLSYDLHIPP
jgi:hypothetical protein